MKNTLLNNLLTAVVCLFASVSAQAQFSGSTTQYPTTDYSFTSISFGLSDVAAALDTDAATLGAALVEYFETEDPATSMFFVLQTDGTESSNSMNYGKSFWMDVWGNISIWGDNSVFYASPNVDVTNNILRFDVGQMPSVMEVGQSVSATIKLKFNGKEVSFTITLNVIAYNISFKDENVKAICIAKWDTDRDGYLSVKEAAAVTTIETVFKGRKIVSFNELSYFKNLTTIGSSAFAGCTSLTEIQLPKGVTSIGYSAFKGCTSLTEIQLPEGVTAIGSSAFSNCTSLTEIHLPEGVTTIEDYAFYYCTSLTEIQFPKEVTSIGGSAFSNCTSLAEIHLPEGVTAIGSSAFSYCKSLAEIQLPEGLTSIGRAAFYSCTSLADIHLPEGLTSIGELTFAYCSNLSNVQIPGGVISIGSSAFADCTSLTEIQLPKGVTSIGYSAFEGCASLAEIHLPEGVTSIGYSAFEGCASLAEIHLPEGLTSIGTGAFKNCKRIKEITIPKNVTRIGYCIFQGCESLSSIRVAEENTTYDSRANCNAVIETSSSKMMAGCKDTTFPEGLRSIGDAAFRDCRNLTSVTLPEGVKTIEYYAFQNCSELESVVMPESLTTIDEYAFDGCMNLISVTVAAEPCTITANTFSNRENATLHVKFGTKGRYAVADYWKEFKEIVEYGNAPVFGDLNGDGKVTIADVTVLVNIILGKD